MSVMCVLLILYFLNVNVLPTHGSTVTLGVRIKSYYLLTLHHQHNITDHCRLRFAHHLYGCRNPILPTVLVHQTVQGP